MLITIPSYLGSKSRKPCDKRNINKLLLKTMVNIDETCIISPEKIKVMSSE